LTPPTAPTAFAFNRPPVAPDPVEWVTLLKSSAPYDHTPHTEMQLPYPLDEAVQPTSNLGNNVALRNPPPPSPMHDYNPGPTPGDEEMVSPATQLHTFTATEEDVSLPPLPVPPAGELKDLHLQEPMCDILKDTSQKDIPWNTMNGDVKGLHG